MSAKDSLYAHGDKDTKLMKTPTHIYTIKLASGSTPSHYDKIDKVFLEFYFLLDQIMKFETSSDCMTRAQRIIDLLVLSGLTLHRLILCIL